jgi:hypothetical protein
MLRAQRPETNAASTTTFRFSFSSFELNSIVLQLKRRSANRPMPQEYQPPVGTLGILRNILIKLQRKRKDGAMMMDRQEPCGITLQRALEKFIGE